MFSLKKTGFYKHINGGKSKWEGRQQQAMQPKIHWAWRMQAGNMIGDCPLLIVKKEVLKIETEIQD